MSQQQKDRFDMVVKGVIVALLTVIGFFCVQVVTKAEDAHDAVLIINTKVDLIQKDVDDLKRDVKQLK